MNRMHVLLVWVFAGVVLCGCNRGPSLSEIEERERNSRLYTNAMDDLQAGRMEAAIKGFEHVVQQEPKSYSAHFQLATLLQDVRKDYISAIAHYRDYLALRPVSDKATVAQDRVKLCETLLQAEILRKAGGSASNKLASENEALTGERDRLAAQVKKLEGELAKAGKTIARLENENASKHRLLEKMSAAVEHGGASARSTVVKEALASLKQEEAESRRRRLKPTDAELLDEDDAPGAVDLKKARAELDRGDDEKPVRTGSAASASLADAKALAEDADRTVKPPEGKPAAATTKPTSFDSLLGTPRQKSAQGGGSRPETYVVQEGETLTQIAQRFYGSKNMWRSIQSVNRAIIPMDGRVRAGQVIRLPSGGQRVTHR